MGAVAATVWYFMCVRPVLLADPAAEADEGRAGLWQRVCSGWVMHKGDSLYLMGCFKTIMSFYQMLGSFLYTFNVTWDVPNALAMQYASISTFNFIQFPGPNVASPKPPPPPEICWGGRGVRGVARCGL